MTSKPSEYIGYEKIQTYWADQMLSVYDIRTKEGFLMREVAKDGQKEIMECILTRGKFRDRPHKNRIHVMAHTRYGKSSSIGGATAIRASTKGESWLIIAPTKEQSQIIMDSVIHACVSSEAIKPWLSATLAKQIKTEQLTSRRSRDHITFIGGGEVRAMSMEQTMGFGCPNVILDEAGLINNEFESKVFRMLGDQPGDTFYMKVGNPFFAMDTDGHEHHFYEALSDMEYHHINIDWRRSIEEGRMTHEFINQAKKKPNFDVLYENVFPDIDIMDSEGYRPLFTHSMIKNALISEGSLEGVGSSKLPKLGADPADGGENESTICVRYENFARVVHNNMTTDLLSFADIIIKEGLRIGEWLVDKQGIGAGTVRMLVRKGYESRLTAVNGGDKESLKEIKIDKDTAYERFENVRAYAFNEAAEWLKNGGKLEAKQGVDWTQLMSVKWKNNESGKMQIISKQKLHKRKVHDLGIADCLSFTFMPTRKRMNPNARPTQGVDMYRGQIKQLAPRPTLAPGQAKPFFPTRGGGVIQRPQPPRSPLP